MPPPLVAPSVFPPEPLSLSEQEDATTPEDLRLSFSFSSSSSCSSSSSFPSSSSTSSRASRAAAASNAGQSLLAAATRRWLSPLALCAEEEEQEVELLLFPFRRGRGARSLSGECGGVSEQEEGRRRLPLSSTAEGITRAWPGVGEAGAGAGAGGSREADAEAATAAAPAAEAAAGGGGGGGSIGFVVVVVSGGGDDAERPREPGDGARRDGAARRFRQRLADRLGCGRGERKERAVVREGLAEDFLDLSFVGTREGKREEVSGTLLRLES